MQCSRNSDRAAGFTLIEMLIIAPIIIIFIGIIIVMITSVTGESLQARERNTMAYQVQDALDLIEMEGSRSATYPSTTGTLTSPQGSNGSTAAFSVANNDASSSDNDVLIIKTPATTKNPTTSGKELVYYNSPNACASADVTKNDYYPITTVYFVASGSLWQRTILPSSGTPCSTPWQRSSCAESAPLTGVCKTYDQKLATDVTSFSVQYLKADGTPETAANASTARAVNVTISTQKLVAGKTITYTGSTRSVALNGGSEVVITDGSKIQTVTSGNCPTNRTMTVDARDNNTYWVQKLADGKCWMLTNLAYAGGGTNTYSDVKTITQGSTTTYTDANYYIPTGANPTTNPTQPSTSTSGTGQYGYLYNWCAAMGVQSSTSACSSSSSPTPNTNISICPAGWRLPTSNGGEFTALNTAVNSGSTSSDSGLRTTWLGQRSGTWSNGWYYVGTQGTYWSSTQGSSTYAYGLLFASTGVDPSYNYYKFSGYAVRCVTI